MCIAAKVSRCVQITKDAIKDGQCVVIGLQSTGEARMRQELMDRGNEYVFGWLVDSLFSHICRFSLL